MQSDSNHVPLFVLIDCDAHSRHRNPGGIYKVDVFPERSLLHTACAAIEIAKEFVAFMDENMDKASIRVFSEQGDEICISKSVHVKHCEMGHFRGRTLEYPESITLQ